MRDPHLLHRERDPCSNKDSAQPKREYFLFLSIYVLKDGCLLLSVNPLLTQALPHSHDYPILLTTQPSSQAHLTSIPS